ncbi:hypothetical protein LCGC14_3116770, partial [marine sediment metagenome]
INNDPTTFTVMDDVGANTHKITVLKSGTYRLVFGGSWTSSVDDMTVKFDLRVGSSVIGGTLRQWISREGSGAGTDLTDHTFHIEVLVTCEAGDELSVYLYGTADATAVLRDAILLAERVDIL